MTKDKRLTAIVPLTSLRNQNPDTEDHGLPRGGLRQQDGFLIEMPLLNSPTVPPAKYRYLSYFFQIPIGVTICVSANTAALIPPEISGFALTPDYPGIQERYVSAAG
jgi:hypothetical protein